MGLGHPRAEPVWPVCVGGEGVEPWKTMMPLVSPTARGRLQAALGCLMSTGGGREHCMREEEEAAQEILASSSRLLEPTTAVPDNQQ